MSCTISLLTSLLAAAGSARQWHAERSGLRWHAAARCAPRQRQWHLRPPRRCCTVQLTKQRCSSAIVAAVQHLHIASCSHSIGGWILGTHMAPQLILSRRGAAGQQNSPSMGGQPAGSGGSDELPDQYQACPTSHRTMPEYNSMPRSHSNTNFCPGIVTLSKLNAHMLQCDASARCSGGGRAHAYKLLAVICISRSSEVRLQPAPVLPSAHSMACWHKSSH